MTTDYIAHAKTLDENARSLIAAAPEYMKALAPNREIAYRDGALDAKAKELIALTYGIASGCDGCITHHSRAAVRKGVTREEFVEALVVCLQMGGGPAMARAGEALAAYDQFAAKIKRPVEPS